MNIVFVYVYFHLSKLYKENIISILKLRGYYLARKKRLILKKENAALFILILMVLSVFGMWQASQANEKEYNGFKFKGSQSGWVLKVDGNKYLFNYLPQQVEHLNSSGVSILGPKVYFGIDPEQKGVEQGYILDYLGNIVSSKNIRPVLSCTQEKECPNDNWPIVNCDNAEAEVIMIKQGNESKIFKQNKCYIIQAKMDGDLGLLRERFVYDFLGVIK